MKLARVITATIAAGTLAASIHNRTVTDLGLLPDYAQTSWPTLHRDSSNSDFAPFVAADRHQTSWSALDGAAVLPAPVIGPEGNLYVTTGRGPGTGHLHAFDRAGNLLWESTPQQSLDDLDSRAAFSAPLVDRDGRVYVGDANQLWSFGPDGMVLWVVPIPGGQPFASLILTQEGYVGGTTLGGTVALFHREDGSPAARVFELPGGPGPAGTPVPPGTWVGGLLDPAIIADAFHLFLGQVFEVTNTPAVHPETGRIYVAAAGSNPAQGVVYGLDLAGGEITIAFQTSMGGGIATSPAISFDGGRVYTVDGIGVMTALDATSGAPLWTVPAANGATSPTVGADETIYTGGLSLTARDPHDGSTKWSRNYDVLAAALLPTLPPNPPAFVTGKPVARTNSVISASATRLYVVLVLGYEYIEPLTGGRLVQPRVSVLGSVNPLNGTLTGVVTIRDTSEGLISIGTDGRVYVSHAAMLSSIFYHGLNQLLPPALRTPGPPPGGFTALDPLSFLQVARSGVEWVSLLDSAALSDLWQSDLAAPLTALKRGRAQLGATVGVLAEAEEHGEITAASLRAAQGEIQAAVAHQSIAVSLIGLPSPTTIHRAFAAWRIRQADLRLSDALAAMRN